VSVRRVFLAGEGRHELGGFANEPPYRSPEPVGVLQALLERCADAGTALEIVGARRWKSIRKYMAGGHASAEARAVLGLHVDAIEHGCAVLAFVRDTDGDTQRAADIALGLAMAQEKFPTVQAIGGVAVQSLDAWGLALTGQRRTEARNPAAAKAALDANGVGSTEARAQAVREADLDTLPDDAASLAAFIDRARAVLAP
jgi:hypothetical protein